ncbi:hypothetical protein [Paenibacillus sp. L3-i20]|uniref:hypothetical protein n=1 Tax=Paenibacillus sp. L3-i20 TaxID=2905833 RepID=UPI00207E584E|nr:hypothetical protein L3i20_v204690 [Paenibacillus sp. L3-i20]
MMRMIYDDGWSTIWELLCLLEAAQHESDLTPGLANGIAIPFATGVCTTFPETVNVLSAGKCCYIGPVIRDKQRYIEKMSVSKETDSLSAIYNWIQEIKRN